LVVIIDVSRTRLRSRTIADGTALQSDIHNCEDFVHGDSLVTVDITRAHLRDRIIGDEDCRCCLQH